jgi:hypothetical protein
LVPYSLCILELPSEMCHMTKDNVAAAGLTLDEWRPFFNERHTGDNQASKNTAFARARKELVDKGLLKCSDDIYRLGDKAT